MGKVALKVHAQYGAEVPSDAKERARNLFASSLLDRFGSIEAAKAAHDRYYVRGAFQSQEPADREAAKPWREACKRAFAVVSQDDPAYFPPDDNRFFVSFPETDE